MLRLLLLLPLSFFFVCSNGNALIGGKHSNDFLSAIAFPDLGCSAVRVSEYRYLLAGHCVNFTGFKYAVKPGDTMTVLYRTQNANDKDSVRNEATVTVKNIRIHSSYIEMIQSGKPRTKSTYDLATIDIEELNRNIPIATLFKLAPKSGQLVYFTGYGCEKYNADPKFNFKVAKKKIARVETEAPVFVVEAEDAEVNTGSTGCPGDSGSASYVIEKNTRKIIGINNFTYGFLGLEDDNSIRFEQNVSTDIVRLDSPVIQKWIYSK
jgi:hypothetical protein